MFKGYRNYYNSLAHQPQNNMLGFIALANTLFFIGMTLVNSIMFHGIAIGGGYDRVGESLAITIVSGILLNMVASQVFQKALKS